MLVKMYFDMITLTDFLVSAQSDAQSVKNFQCLFQPFRKEKTFRSKMITLKQFTIITTKEASSGGISIIHKVFF